MASSSKKNQPKTSSRKSQPLIDSPVVKREQNRPVILQGWLMKRGSDGLMLWKKRWFVLSDYCLFYYKDTSEEKILGSLILASYKISQCSPDEKGYKKFSFKAEHTNMRTYFFAAENNAFMEQWIKAMTLASLLEENISCDFSSDGIKSHKQESRRSIDLMSTNQDIAALSGLRTPDPQPVYANAPPKPKRLNESSSPECSTDMQFREDSFHNQPYPVIYNNVSSTQQYSMSPPPKQGFMLYDRKSDMYCSRMAAVPSIRRRQQKSPCSRPGTMPPNISKDSSQSSKNVSFSFPPRPHSVDFLEYSGKNSSDISHDSSEKSKLHYRPKSSLSSVTVPDDDSMTAEEYARRMRMSSLYVKPAAKRTFSDKTGSISGTVRSSSSSRCSNVNQETPKSRTEMGIKTERMPGVLYRTKNMKGTDNTRFSRSASARLSRPMSDCRDEYVSQEATGAIPKMRQSESPQATNNEPVNKVQQKEEAMKRLLEWKNRMTHSSLRKAQNKTFTRDRHSSYHSQTKNELFQSGRSTSATRTGISNECVPVSLSKSSERVLSYPSGRKADESSRNIRHSSPAGAYYQYSSDDEGLEGCESKYPTSVAMIENISSERDQNQIMIDEDKALLNEPNIVHHKIEPTEPLNQSRSEFTNDKLFPNFNKDSNNCSNLELPSNSNCHLINNPEDENHKNKITNNSMNVSDYNKKMNMSHSIETERDEEWGIKLDESRVIKEFSYHYITTGEYDVCQTKNDIDSHMNSNFKTKIPSNHDLIDIEACRQNSLNNQYSQSKKELQNFSFSEPTKQLDGSCIKKENTLFHKLNGNAQKKFNKGIIPKENMRSYYRDMTKLHLKVPVNKSLTANEKLDKRLVQSDSEALLYDTSSDAEDKIVFHQELLKKPEISSDDERDEEVAAVLSKENIFPSPVFDTVKSPYMKCNSTDNLEIPSSTNCEQSSYPLNHEKNLSTSTDVNSDVPEENYMPMTPRKKSNASKSESVHSRSNSASHTLIIENLLGSTEESPYVEMTQNNTRESENLANRPFTKINSDGKNESLYTLNMDNERYCEIGKSKDIQYEMIYESSISQEPLYMEVPLLKGKNDKSMLTLLNGNETIHEFNKRNGSKENINQLKISSRPSLPDILNSTAPTLNQGSRSDSSDADDEASKDLDSLDAPRHPRFSLSDTFRPASYYLGASLGDRAIITMNTEHHDSSDSDLVSPPPIPTSSPPLDDLETSMESTIVNKESPISNLKSDSTNIYSNELFLNTNIKNFMPSYNIKNSLRNSNSNLYEASSEESVNYEKREQRLKRRPLSADILSSLQDINFIMPSTDAELKVNACNDETKLTEPYNEEQLGIESDHLSNIKVFKHKSKNNDSLFITREDISNDNDSENDMRFRDNRFIHQDPIYCSRTSPVAIDACNMQNQYENLPVNNREYKYFIEKYNCSENADSFREKMSQIKDKSVNSSNEHQNTAPYYYSDLLKIDTKNFHEFDKNRWEEHITNENEKESAILSPEKALPKMMNFNQFNESDSPKLKTHSSETFKDHSNFTNYKYGDNSSPLNIVKEPIDYSKNSLNKENSNSSFKKMFFPQQEPLDALTPHRTRSLEGLIDSHPNGSRTINSIISKKNTINSKSKSQKNLPNNANDKVTALVTENTYPPNQDIWEEDTLWRESLRKVSLRHTRSLEDLDRKDCSQLGLSPSPNVSGETKTYENVKVTYTHDKDNQSYPTESCESPPTKMLLKHTMRYKNEISSENPENCESPKSIENGGNQKYGELRPAKEPLDGNNSSFEIDREKLRQWDLMSSAPAMLSSNRAIIKPITERKSNFPSSIPESQTDENSEAQKEVSKIDKPSPTNISGLVMTPEQEQGQNWNLKVSAGELLGRTHEELVLLLIQLRRQRATVCQSMEKCHREIETKACLADLDKANRLEHLQKLDELKAKLADLEKQYEKGKPLVNLVDNMVKLGSLYQAGSPQKIEFIQRIQEQRLLAEERRDWERIRPDHHELKAKVERLYRLDRVLQEESGTLHSLQQDKGVLERALGGLKTRLQGAHGNSPETEWYKRQQRVLEKELSRVRSILALNSKKLEETVAENARLEQELVVLRQKLQLSRRSAEPGSTNTAALEKELCRVQSLVGNLLRQRQELSIQVRQLTEKSNSLSRQIWPTSPDYFADGASSGRRQLTNGWIETDLDADLSTDFSTVNTVCHSARHQVSYISPLYVNTTDRDCVHDCSNYPDDLYDGSPLSARSPDCSRISESNEEDLFKQSYGLHLKEKPQEIKTVRIVKRESERRQRDRDRSGNIGIPITYTNPKRPITDDRYSERTKSERDLEEVVEIEFRSSEPPPTPGPRSDSVNAVWNLVKKNKMRGKLVSRHSIDKCDALVMQTDSPQLSPVYLSETARKIVEEVAWQGMSGGKRLVPKEKRRHHTMSGPSLIAPQNLFSQMGSRDDLDIERVLRPRLTTPDVVRSTLIRVDPHYTKETIDNILGAPGKIVIPERYIPESQPELTKEEQTKRSKKADAIRKMLCENTASTVAPAPKESGAEGGKTLIKKVFTEEKKNREHLLQLSHILAQQVMEKSKIVAGVNPTAVE